MTAPGKVREWPLGAMSIPFTARKRLRSILSLDADFMLKGLATSAT